jgi:tetratricopeptide (TPR) repeat protein
MSDQPDQESRPEFGPRCFLLTWTLLLAGTPVLAGGAHPGVSADAPSTLESPCAVPDARGFAAVEARAAEHFAILEDPEARSPEPGGADTVSLPATRLDRRCSLAWLLLRVGRLDEAEHHLTAVLAEDPEHLGALLLLAELLERSLRGDEAEELRDGAVAVAPDALPVRLLLAQRAREAGEEEADDARALHEGLLRDFPQSPAALTAVAEYRTAEEALEDAIRLLDQALALDPTHAPAHVQRAAIHQQEGEGDLRIEALHRAVAADSLALDARRALGGALRSQGDVEGAFRHTRVVLATDPYDGSTYQSVGNGASPASWGRYPPLQDDEVDPGLAARLDEGDAHLLSGEWDQAERTFREILEMEPGLAAAGLGLGTAQYRRGDYRDSFRTFRGVVEMHPELGLASFGATYSLRRIQEEGDPEIAEAIERFHQRATPPEPDRIRDVFPDYDRVDDDARKIILLSVAPLSNYIPVLAMAGATFQLLPFHKRLWELPYKETTRGRRTFDLRLWDDVKGQGGFHAVAGEEWIIDVMHGGFNVLAHEFMHQVHSMFEEEQREVVEELFRIAKREGHTLDSYADYNEMEYLAQAYEGMVSPSKRSGLGSTAQHTRQSVRELDPEVFQFLAEVNDRPSFRGNEIVAYRQKVRFLLGTGEQEEAEAAARQSLEEYGEEVDLLLALGSAVRIRGGHEEARELHERAVELDPLRRHPYEALAEDDAFGRHDHAAAALTIERFLARDPESIEGWLRLAEHRFHAGDLDGAEASLDTAAELIGESNPFEAYFSLRGSIAFRRGLHDEAEAAYRHGLENVSRSNINAWADRALIALEGGDPERAASLVGTARGLDADAPRVREMEAVLADAEGRRREAIELLTRLLEDDPTRLETHTTLLRVLGEGDAPRRRELVERGYALIEARAPVAWVYESGRYRARGELSVPAIEDFLAAAMASGTDEEGRR